MRTGRSKQRWCQAAKARPISWRMPSLCGVMITSGSAASSTEACSRGARTTGNPITATRPSSGRKRMN